MQGSSNSTSYHSLASVYDHLMSDAPYDQWLKYAEQQWADQQIQPKTVVDLACGTGTITAMLVDAGYQVIGIDLSEEMLAVTHDKIKHKKGSKVNLFNQDMRELKIPFPVDSIICFCDSLSYLLKDEDICTTFKHVYEALNPGGIFLFDVHSIYKINEVFGSETFTLSEENMAYIWQCHLIGNDTVEHELDIFIKEGRLYERFEEVHQQRGYGVHTVVKWLSDAGFSDIECTADFTNCLPRADSERLFFRCIKKG